MAARKKGESPKKEIKTNEKTLAKPRKNKKSKSSSNGNEKDFFIVGIGASAGGLEAFENFFQNMPKDSGMAFVLVPHLDPKRTSLMPDLIQKYTKMAVIHGKDGVAVQPNTVYIVPPNADLALLHGVLQLIKPVESPGARLPIDFFFRTLAQDLRERAICVILSGMGTDGTLGLREIKGELGMAMVQDPNTAKYSSMPKSAIETGLVDYVLPAEKMPKQLIKYTQHAAQKVSQKIISNDGILPNTLQKIFILLRTHTGHDFAFYKPNTIYRRIERRMNVHQIEKIANYVRFLQENPAEVVTLFKELLIGVTNFYRDPEAFEVLKKKVLPDLLKEKPNDSNLRVWVPGCSTGEEAYSVAMVLRECLDEINKNINVQIFATDIDSDAIEVARTGTYPESVSVDVTSKRLNRFFIKEADTYRIKKDIREMLIFAPQDIIKDPPFTKLDMICCRNLLIYLDSVLQKKLLPLFHYSLQPGGVLFLGTSESIGGFIDLFSVVNKKWKVFKKKASASAMHAIVEFPITPIPDRLGENPFQKEMSLSLPQVAEKALLKRYAPPSLIVDEKGDILYVHGRTGKYLEPAQGEANWNILKMARDGLRLELPSAMRKAMTQKTGVTRRNLQVKDNGDIQAVHLTVKPLMETEASGLLMVVFEEAAKPEPGVAPKEKPGSKKKPDKKTEELEKELKYTKESLQSTIEELETSNEELRSANEELQSTNEEWQSANEELETSKEEQQSLNEELITVNAELQGKIDELTVTYNDMRNLLDSIEVPTVFLDNDLNIKRFTSHATKIINLIHSDIGRPIEHIVSKLKYKTLTDDAKEVLRSLVFKETEVESTDGRWYSMRILPYRTIDNVIDGVVVTFADITERKRAEQALNAHRQSLEMSIENRTTELKLTDKKLDKEIKAHRLASTALDESTYLSQKILGLLPSIVYLFDIKENRMVFINREMGSALGYSPDETVGMGTNVIQNLLHPKDVVVWEKNIQAISKLNDEEVLEFEYRLRDAHGEWQRIHVSDLVFDRSVDGSPKQVLGTAKFIETDKKGKA